MDKFHINLIENGSSSTYYSLVEEIGKKYISYVKGAFEIELDDFKEFHKITSYENTRSTEEFIVDILIISIMWKEFYYKSLTISKINKNLLKKYSRYNEKSSLIFSKIWQKKYDYVVKKSIYVKFYDRVRKDKEAVDLCAFERIYEYISHIKELRIYADRMRLWNDFLKNIRGDYASNFIKKISKLAKDFSHEASFSLSKYLEGYFDYLQKFDIARYRELDLFQYYIPPSIIYLNMISAEIFNIRSIEKIKNIQDRMFFISNRFIGDDKKCPVFPTNRGRLCDECSFDCRVSKITRIFKSYNFDVYLSENNTNAFSDLSLEENVGILAVADIDKLIETYYNYRESDAIVSVVPYDKDDMKSDLEINMDYIINNILN